MTLSIAPGNLKWPMGGWLRRIASPALPTDSSEQAAFEGPNGLVVLASIDNTPKFGPLLHVSMSHRRRDPFWHEIKAVRAIFFPPDIDVMMMLPAQQDYINLHEHTFHLWQTPERWGIR